MQRLVKTFGLRPARSSRPIDLRASLGAASVPGNPADDPEVGAPLYNEFAQEEAKGVQRRSPQEQVADIIEWTIATPGEAARSLAADLAATYQGKHKFRMDDLELWDEETKPHRAHLIFHNEELMSIRTDSHVLAGPGLTSEFLKITSSSRTLDIILQSKSQVAFKMSVYTIWNNKGGVGKSYLTFQIASEYARQNKEKSCCD